MTESSPAIVALAAARAEVLARIAAACARVGRDPAEVTLVAVSKTVEAGRLRDAVAAGLTLLGENRVQEGAAKAPEVPGARWQLIGPLQSNKARRALEVYELIQSVESVGLAERLDRLAREVRGAGPSSRYPVLLQVNVDDDPAKAGFAPSALPEALERIAAPRRARGPRAHDDRAPGRHRGGGPPDVRDPARPARAPAHRTARALARTSRWA